MRLLFIRILIQVMNGLMGMGLGILTARWLGTEARGALSLLLLLPYFGGVLLTLGMNDAAPYLVNRLGVDVRDITRFFFQYSVAVGGIACAALGIGIFTNGQRVWGYHFDFLLAFFAAILLLCRLSSMLGRGLLMTTQNYKTTIWLDFAESVLPLIFFLSFSIAFGSSLHGAVLAYLLSALFQMIAIAILIRPKGAGFINPSRPLDIFRKSAAYGTQTLLRSIGGIVLQRADFFLVGAMLGSSALGVYSVANTIAEAVLRIPDAASWLLGPKVSRETEQEAVRTTNKFLMLIFGLTAISALFAGLIAPSFVKHFIGAKFIGVATVLPAILFGVTISVIYKILGSSLIGRGFAFRVAGGTWIGASVMLVLDVLLLPKFGLLGAGIAACIGYSINSAWVAFSYMQKMPKFVGKNICDVAN
ncbi:oligosaccharide flippase family protein [Massilia aerilata]|uniref:Oligosaccharide flippase family protein n=1 Tax=Massilia aerilata TaxID=453817 RepID=A0ABW0RY26_9BURK